MKFTATPYLPPHAPITSLQGSIQATLTQLSAVFGEPHIGEPGDDVLIHWAVKFEDGTHATLYLWRHPEIPNPDMPVGWNIGGVDRRAVGLIHDAFAQGQGLGFKREAQAN